MVLILEGGEEVRCGRLGRYEVGGVVVEGRFGYGIGRVDCKWYGGKIGLIDSYCYFVFDSISVEGME